MHLCTSLFNSYCCECSVCRLQLWLFSIELLLSGRSVICQGAPRQWWGMKDEMDVFSAGFSQHLFVMNKVVVRGF